MWLCSLVLMLCCQEWQFKIHTEGLKSAADSEYFVVFTASWCGPCQRLKQNELVQLSDKTWKLKNSDYQVTVVDIEKDTQWKKSVVSLPTIWMVDRESRWPIEEWVGYTEASQLLAPTQIDGVCRLSANNKKWSGVAIAPDLVLTCAHHDEADNIKLEFPLAGSSGTFVSVRGRVRKANRKSDVSVIDFRLPAKYRLKSYPVRAGKPIRIKGYAGIKAESRLLEVALEKPAGVLDGYTVRTLQLTGQSESGMSGSPVLAEDDGQLTVTGIQFGGKDNVIDFATVDSINALLQEAQSE